MALAIPLDIIVGIVTVGITSVAIFTWAVGWSTPATLSSAQQATDRYALDYPDDTVTEVILTDDGAGALLLLEGGGAALVTAMGQDFTVRKLGQGSLRALAHTGSGLRLELPDLGMPAVQLRLGASGTRARLHTALVPLLA